LDAKPGLLWKLTLKEVESSGSLIMSWYLLLVDPGFQVLAQIYRESSDVLIVFLINNPDDRQEVALSACVILGFVIQFN
jgi:hypothetical protein